MAHLYAIVGTIERARFMLDAGVPYVQLRFKAEPLEPYRDEIRGWRARYPASRVIVNDDLDLAAAAQAWGVHLGQEDAGRYLPERVKSVVRESGLALGVSTHNDAELARAKALGAALVGFGPLFDTRTKQLKHPPHGLGPLARAVREFGLPVIAIGGIGEETLDAVADTGVAMIAMVAYLDGLKTRAEVEALKRRIAR